MKEQDHNQQISLFDNTDADKPVGTIDLWEFLSGSRWADTVTALRQLIAAYGLADAQALPDYAMLRKQLPGAAIGGVFRSRRDDMPEGYSGFVALLINDPSAQDTDGISIPRMVLSHRPEVAAVVRTFDGTRLAAIVRLARPDDYQRQIIALTTDYRRIGLQVDMSSARLNFILTATFDENIYINQSAAAYEGSPMDEKINSQFAHRQNETAQPPVTVINEQTVERIKESVSLADIVAQSVELRHSTGGRLVGCCPFHEEKTGSFTVYPDGHFYCYGCQKSGDVITFVQLRDHVSFREAVRRLAERVAGLPQTDDYRYSRAAYLKRQREDELAPVQYIPQDYLVRSLSGTSVFTDFLGTLFSSATVGNIMKAYQIGSTRDRQTIFWQVDRSGNVRQGKIVPYMINGHRDKSRSTHIDSVAYRLRLKHFSQCLFGEHLLAQWPDKPVALVEAEKTAAICYGFMPQYVWLATGGKGNFKPKMLLALRGRMVSVFPDYDAYDEWRTKAVEIPDTTMIFSNILQSIDFPDIEHADIADVLVSLRQHDAIAPIVGSGSGDPITDVALLCKSVRKNVNISA